MSNRSANKTQSLHPVPEPQVDVDPAEIIAQLRSELAAKRSENEQLRAANDALTADVARLKELTLRDELTGLYNRRHFNTVLREEFVGIDRRRKSAGAYSMLFIDVDNFGAFNKIHGELVGDTVLRRVAKTMDARKRASDIFVRYGGEELILVLPQTDLDGAAIVAEAFRQAVEDIRFETMKADLRVTVSIGVATLRPGDKPEDLIHRADSAMRMAKAQGKNRVAVNRTGSTPPMIAVAKK